MIGAVGSRRVCLAPGPGAAPRRRDTPDCSFSRTTTSPQRRLAQRASACDILTAGIGAESNVGSGNREMGRRSVQTAAGLYRHEQTG
jgi:hypothetical protein